MNKGMLIAALYLFAACEKNEVCNSPTQLAVENLETLFGCQYTTHQMHIDLTETHTIIRSQNDFENRVTGNCMREIDFGKYDLVIGKKRLTSGVHEIRYDYTRDCDGTHNLKVEIQHNAASEAPNITYHALVPKLAPSQTVNVTVESKY
ncbi:hypothetical protein [Parapedobacter sp. DT-150]|uniref:hypothetical protein n=1 Tax=Parapedobacter sp. DT-150 TaxID=3396162 RepID=UPI003F1C6A10